MAQDKTHSPRLEKIVVEAALAATQGEAPGACPDPATLAALVDGRLGRGEADALFTHLDQCPDCYHQWVALHEMADDQAGSAVVSGPWGFMKQHRKLLGMSGGMATLAASLVLFFLFTTAIDRVPQQIAASYKQIREMQGAGLTPTDLVLRFESGASGFHMGGVSEPSPGLKAYYEGLVAGRQALVPGREGAEPFHGTDADDDFFRLGQWRLLLQAACAASQKPGPAFWRTQEKTRALLFEAFTEKGAADKDAALAAGVLGAVGAEFAGMAESPGYGAACRGIRDRFDRIESRLVFYKSSL